MLPLIVLNVLPFMFSLSLSRICPLLALHRSDRLFLSGVEAGCTPAHPVCIRIRHTGLRANTFAKRMHSHLRAARIPPIRARQLKTLPLLFATRADPLVAEYCAISAPSSRAKLSARYTRQLRYPKFYANSDARPDFTKASTIDRKCHAMCVDEFS